MRKIFILNKDIYFQTEKQFFDKPLFFGYWNALNPDFGGLDLIENILKINSANIKELINKLNLTEFDSILGISENKRKNYFIIYGPTLLSYAFVSIRINFQFNYLRNLLNKNKINELFFSHEEILEAHSFLNGKINSLNNDAFLISNKPSITNLLLLILSCTFFQEKVSVIDKNQNRIDIKLLFEKIKKINIFKFEDINENKFSSKLSNNKLNLNLVNSKSFLEKIVKKLNFIEGKYLKYFRTDSNIFFRKDLSLEINDIEISLLKFITPQIDQSLLIKLFKQIESISFIWENIKVSSLHFSSLKVRLLLNHLRNTPQKECKIKLFNEHGSSFFKTSSHNYSFDEDIFNAVTVYRKNYPLKKYHPYELGITTQKIPFRISILRKISITKKFPIIIGSQIFNDLKNVNYRYLLLTDDLNNSYVSLFKLLSKKFFKVGFLPSKNVRSGNYKDPISKLAFYSKFKIILNYNQALINSSCLILTYPETTLADAVLMRIPFLLFCDIDNYPLHNNSKYWYIKLYEFGVAYKLDEFEKLQKMITSGKIYALWRNGKFKAFLNSFAEFIL